MARARTGMEEQLLYEGDVCTCTVLRELPEDAAAMVTAWGCSGDSACVVCSLETSAVVTTGGDF